MEAGSLSTPAWRQREDWREDEGSQESNEEPEYEREKRRRRRRRLKEGEELFSERKEWLAVADAIVVDVASDGGNTEYCFFCC